jgi:hypothetical protein
MAYSDIGSIARTSASWSKYKSTLCQCISLSEKPIKFTFPVIRYNVSPVLILLISLSPRKIELIPFISTAGKWYLRSVIAINERQGLTCFGQSFSDRDFSAAMLRSTNSPHDFDDCYVFLLSFPLCFLVFQFSYGANVISLIIPSL